MRNALAWVLLAALGCTGQVDGVGASSEALALRGSQEAGADGESLEMLMRARRGRSAEERYRRRVELVQRLMEREAERESLEMGRRRFGRFQAVSEEAMRLRLEQKAARLYEQFVDAELSDADAHELEEQLLAAAESMELSEGDRELDDQLDTVLMLEGVERHGTEVAR